MEKKNWCFLKIKSSCEKIIQVALLFKKKESGTFDNYFAIIWKHNQLTRMFIIRFYKKGFQKSFGQLNLTGIPRINQVRSSHKLTQVPWE